MAPAAQAGVKQKLSVAPTLFFTLGLPHQRHRSVLPSEHEVFCALSTADGYFDAGSKKTLTSAAAAGGGGAELHPPPDAVDSLLPPSALTLPGPPSLARSAPPPRLECSCDLPDALNPYE